MTEENNTYVKLHQDAAGPNGFRKAGTVIAVTKAEADAMVQSNQATMVGEGDMPEKPDTMDEKEHPKVEARGAFRTADHRPEDTKTHAPETQKDNPQPEGSESPKGDTVNGDSSDDKEAA